MTFKKSLTHQPAMWLAKKIYYNDVRYAVCLFYYNLWHTIRNNINNHKYVPPLYNSGIVREGAKIEKKILHN